MTEPQPQPQPPEQKRFMMKGRHAIAAMLLFAVLFTLVMTWIGLRVTQRAAAKIGQKQEKRLDLAVTITQIRALNRLETAQMDVTHISQIQQSYGVIPNSLAGDELTFLAMGQVIAGIDMSQLKNDDVRLEGDGLVVKLPPTQILVSRLDNNRSKVIDRDTGVLRRADIDLESRARAGAEGAIRSEAVRKGILDLAEKNAQAQLAQLLNRAGFTRVRFEQATPAPPPAQR
jgi:hypothetical protein